LSPRWPKIRFLRRSYQAPPTSFPAVVDSPPGTQSPFSAGLLVEKPLWPRTLSVLVKLPPHLSSQPAAPQRPLPTTKRKMTTFCHRRHHTHTPPILSPRNGPPHWRLASTSWGDSLQTKTTTAETTLSLLILISFPTQYDRATSAECSEGCTSSNHQSKNRSTKCRFRGKNGRSGTRRASHLDQGRLTNQRPYWDSWRGSFRVRLTEELR